MAKSSTFTDDLRVEREISNFLDKYFYEIYFNGRYKRINDINLQHQGIDIQIQSKFDNSIINIDEKFASHYVNFDLKTFAFEMTYVMEDMVKEGWTFGEKYTNTEYYNIGYVTANNIKSKEWKKITKRNIEKIELLIISKEKIQSYLYKRNKLLTSKDYLELSKKIRDKMTKEKKSFFSSNNILWYLTPEDILSETPLNILIPKDDLICISDKHYLVTKTGTRTIN